MFLRSHYFIEGDELRIEQTTSHTTLQAALTAARGADGKKPFGTIALFDLDPGTCATMPRPICRTSSLSSAKPARFAAILGVGSPPLCVWPAARSNNRAGEP